LIQSHLNGETKVTIGFAEVNLQADLRVLFC